MVKKTMVFKATANFTQPNLYKIYKLYNNSMHYRYENSVAYKFTNDRILWYKSFFYGFKKSEKLR